MRTLRNLGSLAFVLGLFTALFAGVPWYVIIADDPVVPLWLRIAVFLLLGMFFRNPVIPAIVLFVWEGINPFLPSLIKKVSVIYYVESLCPVSITGSDFQILADPAPLWLSLPGILMVTALVQLVSGLRARHMEIDYGQD